MCETTFDSVCVLDSAFSTEDPCFQEALEEAMDALKAVMLSFGYNQKLEPCIPESHQVNQTSTASAVLIH